MIARTIEGPSPAACASFRLSPSSDRGFLVCSGEERYSLGGGIEASDLTALADALEDLRAAP